MGHRQEVNAERLDPLTELAADRQGGLLSRCLKAKNESDGNVQVAQRAERNHGGDLTPAALLVFGHLYTSNVGGQSCA